MNKTASAQRRLGREGYILTYRRTQVRGSQSLPAEFYAPWSDALVCQPKAPLDLGFVDLSAFMAGPFFQDQAITIKVPNDDRVFVPKGLEGLASFIQGCIDREWVVDAATVTRRYRLVVDFGLHKAGKAHRAHAAKIHVHSPMMDVTAGQGVPVSRIQSVGLPDNTWFWTGRIQLHDVRRDICASLLVPSTFGHDLLKPKARHILWWTSAHAHTSPVKEDHVDGIRCWVSFIAEDARSDAEDDCDTRSKIVSRALRNPMLAALAQRGIRHQRHCITRWTDNTRRLGLL